MTWRQLWTAWRHLFTLYWASGQQSLYLLAQGNHQSGLVLPHYASRFKMPGNSSSPSIRARHISLLITQNWYLTPLLKHRHWMQFLQNDLEGVDRTEFHWLVVHGHRPLYCSANMSDSLLSDERRIRLNPDCQERVAFLRGVFEKFWYKFQVDLVVSGHAHAYEDLGRFIIMSRCLWPGSQSDLHRCLVADLFGVWSAWARWILLCC